jgi:YesN/AraC family two-component response regulator
MVGRGTRQQPEGAETLTESSVDLVLTHIIRPDMEGVETVMHLKQTRPELKVIVMSVGDA